MHFTRAAERKDEFKMNKKEKKKSKIKYTCKLSVSAGTIEP